MKINVSFNIENSKRGWAAVANHVKHDPHQKHANKDIEPELRSLDFFATKSRYSVREWQEKKFGAFVQAHDEKLKKQGRREKDRYYNSVQGFLVRKNRQTAVVTFGNNDSWKQLIRNSGCREGKDYTVEHEDKGNGNTYEWYKLNPDSKRAKELQFRVLKAFVVWHDDINNSSTFSKYMQLGRCAVHMDEHGAPHMHVEVAFCGKTKKGAPTPSMSAAITQLATELTGEKPRNNREAFHCFRDATDRLFVQKINEITVPADKSPIQPNKLNIEPFTLERTGRDANRNMKTFKATEDQRLAEERQLKRQHVELDDEKKELEKQKQELERQKQAQRQIALQQQQQQAQLEQMQREDKKLREENARLKKENKSLKERMKAFVGVAREACGYLFGPRGKEVDDTQTLADGLRAAWQTSKSFVNSFTACVANDVCRITRVYKSYNDYNKKETVAMKGRSAVSAVFESTFDEKDDHRSIVLVPRKMFRYAAQHPGTFDKGVRALTGQQAVERGEVPYNKLLTVQAARKELQREQQYPEWEIGTAIPKPQKAVKHNQQRQHDFGPDL